jgi:hypothetical protein
MKFFCKIKTRKIIVLIVAISIAGNLFVAQPARADYWGGAYMASMMKQMMEVIYKTIQDALRGALKQAAAEMMHKMVGNLISGGSGSGGGALFITDWEDSLVKQPQKATDVYMNDYFTITSRGKAGASNYTEVGQTGQNYSSQLVAQGKASISGDVSQSSLQEYTSHPSQMFEKGDWRAYNSYISSPFRNEYGYVLMTQSANQQKLKQEQEKASVQAIAYQGFTAQKKNGQVITPGSTLKDIQSQSEDMGNKILANAQSIPEVITSIVTKLVTQSVRQGIGNVQQNLQRESLNSNANSQQSMQNQVKTSGPGAVFKSGY